MEQTWKEVNMEGQFEFSLPANLSEAREQGIDSNVARWEGEGITVRVDYGMFSDPLTSYAGRPNYHISSETINGHAARVVGFDEGDGKRLVAAHFHDIAEGRNAKQERLTIVVETDRKVRSEVPDRIIRSIRFQGETE